MPKLKALLCVLLYISTICDSAKILYVMPFTASSHYIAQKDLALELAERGHEVYVIAAFTEKEHPPTYHQIKVNHVSVWDALFDETPNIFTMIDESFANFQQLLYNTGYLVNEIVFNSTEVQKFMEEEHQFDLVISELFNQETLYMFAHKYQAPLVLVTTFGNSFKGNFFGRNPLQLSTVYHEYGASPNPLSFYGRLLNFYYCMYELFNVKFVYLPRQNEYAKRYFSKLPQPVPTLEELAANVSLVLMNSHFSIDTPTAYLPNFIEVGGLNHKTKDKPLPKDLQDIMDSSKHGVVFMSLGSNVRASDLPKDKLSAFLKVFGELKQTVLMKWEDDNVPNIPQNVILRKWFPQRDVLAHPNVKLFIGHGGYLGLQETIAAGVPIIGIPIFGDQYVNIVHTVKNGFGELLEYKNIDETNLRRIVNQMLKDKRYSENAKQLSQRFNDRPMNGIDTAVWWIEYVIRHKGANFIKTPALNLSYFEYQMLDVYLFLFSIVFVALFIVYKTFALIKGVLLKPSKLKTS